MPKPGRTRQPDFWAQSMTLARFGAKLSCVEWLRSIAFRDAECAALATSHSTQVGPAFAGACCGRIRQPSWRGAAPDEQPVLYRRARSLPAGHAPLCREGDRALRP